jgi:hypothetical protein
MRYRRRTQPSSCRWVEDGLEKLTDLGRGTWRRRERPAAGRARGAGRNGYFFGGLVGGVVAVFRPLSLLCQESRT